ncbi:toxic anion resistance protein [Peptoanaerobacter stomatis]
MSEDFVRQEEDYNTQLQTISNQVKASPEIQQIARNLDVRDVKNIMSFGQETATEISKFSDEILSSINNSQIEDSGRMMKQLSDIMDKFDVKDFEDKSSKGFLSNIFGKAKDNIQSLLKKYETMDSEVSKIYVEIKKYEAEIGKTNDMLDNMYAKNIEYYQELEKYIMAGNLAIENLRNTLIPQYEQKALETGNELDNLNAQNARASLEMLEQRVYDLELAKMVAVQSAPQIKLIQRGNYNLLRKIGSAFVVTIPVFKTGIIQAVTIKRQKVQSDSMKALDERTNEMLIRNAKNISAQSVDIAKLSGSSSIKIETLENTFNTIMQGIEETIRIEEENRSAREQGKQRILQLQTDMKNKIKSM